MYTTIKTILTHAVQDGYGVVACSAINMEMARGIVAAATELDAPIIFLLGQNMMRQHAKAELLIPMIKQLAEYSPVPIATCLDHGNDSERIMYAFRNGFSSIMFDGSLYPFERNIELTREVSRFCHEHGLAVEGELGHVGLAATAYDEQNASLYTDPAEAKRFVEETGVDCLAIAVGTAHGEYPKGMVPHIDFETIHQIKSMLPEIPLALHGGSGSGDDNIVKAVAAGINKINVVTDLFLACRGYLSDTLADNPKIPYIELMMGMENAARDLASHWIKLSGSAGKASLIPRENLMGRLSVLSAQGTQE